MDDFEFSHYERRWDAEGWMYLIAWYVHPNGSRKFIPVY